MEKLTEWLRLKLEYWPLLFDVTWTARGKEKSGWEYALALNEPGSETQPLSCVIPVIFLTFHT